MMSLRRTGIFLLVSILFTGLRAAAQGERPVADTTLSDTVVVAAPEGAADVTKSDTMNNAGVDTASASDSLTERSVPDSVVRGWKAEPGFAYANDPRYWKPVPERDESMPAWLVRFLMSQGFRWGIYIILGALLLYAIGRIITENQLGAFYRGARRSGAGGGQVADEAVAEEDIDGGLQQSIDNKDYAQAVRYSYLRALRLLDQRGMIHLKARATNQEYLRELSGTAQEAPFRLLTGAYEKVYYGQFGLSEDSFRRLIQYFSEFDKTLPG